MSYPGNTTPDKQLQRRSGLHKYIHTIEYWSSYMHEYIVDKESIIPG